MATEPTSNDSNAGDPSDDTTPAVDKADAVAAGETPSVAKRGWFYKFMDVAAVVVLVGFAISQYFIWNSWEPANADSVKNMITFAQGIVAQLIVVGWVLLISPFSRKTALMIGLPLLALMMGRWAMMRDIDFDGDMKPKIVWRWESTPEQRYAEYEQSLLAKAKEPVKIEATIAISPLDMAEYRGPLRDGIISGPELIQDFDSTAPKELWKHRVGLGYAGVAVVGSTAITIEQRGNDEVVACYHALTGDEIWNYRYAAQYDEAMGGPGPRSTPTVHDGKVYTFGAFGDLFCLDLKTGKRLWHVNSLQQFELPNNTWAMSCSPLIDGDNVIVIVGGMEGNGLVAYHRLSGEIVWKTTGLPEPRGFDEGFLTGQAAVTNLEGNSKPGYASPMIETILGEKQILNLDGTALSGHDPETGHLLWSYAFQNGAHVNVAQPIVLDGERIFLSASYDVGSEMIQLSKSEDGTITASKLWGNKYMRCKFTSPVYHDGYLYGLDEGIMVCLDAENGKRQWKGTRSGLRGRYGHGQLLLVNGQLLILTEKGQVVLAEPSPDELKEVSHFAGLSPSLKTWNPHSIANGRVYVRNAEEMAAYDLRANPVDESTGSLTGPQEQSTDETATETTDAVESKATTQSEE